MVFTTGFQTNLGVLSVLAGKNDVIYCDRDNHASIFDGARLSYGSLKKYRHNDLDELFMHEEIKDILKMPTFSIDRKAMTYSWPLTREED